MEDDAREYALWRRKNGYRKKINSLELTENKDFHLCLVLTKNIFKARRIYRRMDIVTLWELLTEIYISNYTDPMAELSEKDKQDLGDYEEGDND